MHENLVHTGNNVKTKQLYIESSALARAILISGSILNYMWSLVQKRAIP